METVCLCFFLVRFREIQSRAKYKAEKKWKFSSKSLSLKRLTDNMENNEEYEHLIIQKAKKCLFGLLNEGRRLAMARKKVIEGLSNPEV